MLLLGVLLVGGVGVALGAVPLPPWGYCGVYLAKYEAVNAVASRICNQCVEDFVLWDPDKGPKCRSRCFTSDHFLLCAGKHSQPTSRRTSPRDCDVSMPGGTQRANISRSTNSQSSAISWSRRAPGRNREELRKDIFQFVMSAANGEVLAMLVLIHLLGDQK